MARPDARRGSGAATAGRALIRPAVPADAHAIAEVWVASWLGAYRGLMPEEALASLDVDIRAETTREVLEGGSRHILVVEDDERIVGVASVGRSRDPDAGEGIGELDALYLAPGSWGRGLGGALHDAALDQLRTQGFAETTLWVLDANERARGFYEHRGWRADGSIRSDRVGEARTLVDEVRYRLPL